MIRHLFKKKKKKLILFPQNPTHTCVLLFPGHVCFQSSTGHPLTWKKVWRRRWPFPEATSAWSLGAPRSLPGQAGQELLVPKALLFSACRSPLFLWPAVMSLASNSPHPPLPHTPPLSFRSFPPPPLPRLKAGRCPAGPQIRSSGFLHPDRSLLLASLPRARAPSRSASLPSGRAQPAGGGHRRGRSPGPDSDARGQEEPPAGAAVSAPGSLLRAGLRGTRGTPRPTPPSHLPPPFSRDPSRVRVAFARCILKGERKFVPPVIKTQPPRAGGFRSCVHLSAYFASQREEPSLLVSGLGECQVWSLRRRTYYRWRQFL